MRVVFLCGVFAEENEPEIIAAAKRTIEYSANTLQKKLIQGFRKKECILDVISAPFIGSYPNASKISNFKGFTTKTNQYQYVNFNNIWGIRNFSRAKALKETVIPFAEMKEADKLIVVYSPHTPFLEAAVYAKGLDPSIKICLVLPDLPQYMNLNAKISAIYRLGKKYDIKKFEVLNQQVDSYMLLTDAMKEMVDVHGRPYVVVEGVIEEQDLQKTMPREGRETTAERTIVYTGKLNEKFGVKHLVDAFMKLTNPRYRLVLCGKGDAEQYVLEKCKEDGRINYLGQVSPKAAREWVERADVLVNPRQNNEEYTKYSFPSKNIEYLLSGNPVVGYMLDGVPKEYAEFMHIVKGDAPLDLAQAIEIALNSTEKEQNDKYVKACRYFKQLTTEEVATKLLLMNHK